MSNCVDQTFRVTSSSNEFPGEESYNHRSDFCLIVKGSGHLLSENLNWKLVQTYTKTLGSYIELNSKNFLFLTSLEDLGAATCKLVNFGDHKV